MIYASCPNCGFKEPADTLGEALKKANEHNAGCREQRERPPKRERFMSLYRDEEEKTEWKRRNG